MPEEQIDENSAAVQQAVEESTDTQQAVEESAPQWRVPEEQIKPAIEALLFVTDEPVTAITLADMLEVEPSLAEAKLLELQQDLDQGNRGICLQRVANGWRLFTNPEYHELLERYVLSWDTRKLSQAALETLAIVAYGQPITRNGISTVRGVNSDSSLNSLVDKGLVREAGVSDAPGNPVLYATTKTFLEKFGLSSVADLPPLEDYAPDEETASFLRQSLSAPGFTAKALNPDEDDFGEADDLDLFEDEPGPASEGQNEKAADGEISPEHEASADDDAVSNAAAVSDEESVGASPDVDGSNPQDAMQNLMRSMMADALASSAGLVEKINFDELEFEE